MGNLTKTILKNLDLFWRISLWLFTLFTFARVYTLRMVVDRNVTIALWVLLSVGLLANTVYIFLLAYFNNTVNPEQKKESRKIGTYIFLGYTFACGILLYQNAGIETYKFASVSMWSLFSVYMYLLMQRTVNELSEVQALKQMHVIWIIILWIFAYIDFAIHSGPNMERAKSKTIAVHVLILTGLVIDIGRYLVLAFTNVAQQNINRWLPIFFIPYTLTIAIMLTFHGGLLLGDFTYQWALLAMWSLVSINMCNMLDREDSIFPCVQKYALQTKPTSTTRPRYGHGSRA